LDGHLSAPPAQDARTGTVPAAQSERLQEADHGRWIVGNTGQNEVEPGAHVGSFGRDRQIENMALTVQSAQ
jgi:hypothetical protein